MAYKISNALFLTSLIISIILLILITPLFINIYLNYYGLKEIMPKYCDNVYKIIDSIIEKIKEKI